MKWKVSNIVYTLNSYLQVRAHVLINYATKKSVKSYFLEIIAHLQVVWAASPVIWI